MKTARKILTRSALTVAAGIVIAGGATIARADGFTEWAPVISSTPVVQRMSAPRQECWSETVTTTETRRIGHIGIGAFDTSTNVAVPVTRDVQRCRTVDGYSDVVQGYDVRYRYQGREYMTRLPNDPGDRIPVEVTLTPAPR